MRRDAVVLYGPPAGRLGGSTGASAVSFEVLIPALAFRADDRLDLDLTRAYADRATGTWTNRFILSGSTALGDLLTPTERALIPDVWAEVMDRSRLVACWCGEDVEAAAERKIPPARRHAGVA